MVDSVKSLNQLTLSQAQKTGRLQEFAHQQEQLGSGPIATEFFDQTVKIAARQPQSLHQTSSSHVPGDLNEK